MILTPRTSIVLPIPNKCRWRAPSLLLYFPPTGISDPATPSPLLYDVGTGDRVSLQPTTPSGRTLLAVFDKRSSKPTTDKLSGFMLGAGLGIGARDAEEYSPSVLSDHRRPPQIDENWYPNSTTSGKACPLRRAQDKRRLYRYCRRVGTAGIGRHLQEQGGTSCINPEKRPSQDEVLHPPRRSLSVGDVLCRDHATTKRCRSSSPTRVRLADRSLLDDDLGWSGTSGVTSDTPFAREEVGCRQQKQEQRERLALERRIQQGEKNHAKAKAVACQLACRVLCRNHRTRLLANALWRWKAQAAGSKMDQVRRGEKKREQDQVELSPK